MTPAYARIAESIRARIDSGELPPGARVPSTRQIVAEHGVAMATATKALAALQRAGLVRPVPGVGTVVTGASRPAPPVRVARDPEPGPDRASARARIVRAAVGIADAEGLDALSMRRVGSALGTGAMSLYRYVTGKEELLLLMRDAVFGEAPLPATPPPGRRTQLETAARRLWALYRRHPWLARTPALTRPYAGPHQLAFSEWVLRALSGLGLPDATVFHLHLTLFSFVHGSAASLEAEDREEADSGVSDRDWLRAREAETRAAITPERFPYAARVFLDPELDLNIDTLFEFGVARLLDGYPLPRGG